MRCTAPGASAAQPSGGGGSRGSGYEAVVVCCAFARPGLSSLCKAVDSFGRNGPGHR